MYTEKTPEKLRAMELVPWLLWLTHTQQKCHSISKGLSCTKRREKERRYCGSMWSWTTAVCLTFFFFFFRLACANKFSSLVAFTMQISTKLVTIGKAVCSYFPGRTSMTSHDHRVVDFQKSGHSSTPSRKTVASPRQTDPNFWMNVDRTAVIQFRKSMKE